MLASMLDTNVCIRAMRRGGEQIRVRMMEEATSLSISTIVLHELYVGSELSERTSFHNDLIDGLAVRLTVLDFDVAAARHAANIRSDLQLRGQVIGPNDLLIAGHARSLGLKLITGNLREFSRVEGLRCEDWP